MRGLKGAFAAALVLAASAPFAIAQDAAPPAASGTAPSTPVRVLHSYPHDSRAFTQGLFFHRGRLFESTGQYGESTLREVVLESGLVLRLAVVDRRYFGEGSTDWGDQIVSLTWQNGIGFRWRASDFAPLGTVQYRGEGWGITHDATALILSDGSATLQFIDPKSFAVRRRLRVTDGGRDVRMLNELEYVRGEILANVWMQDRIARIDPASGRVKGWIDCSALVREIGSADPDAVLNGIAYDKARGRLFVTGKDWPKLYEIALPK